MLPPAFRAHEKGSRAGAERRQGWAHSRSTTGSALMHPGRRWGANGGCPSLPLPATTTTLGQGSKQPPPPLPCLSPPQTRGESPGISPTRAGRGCCCPSARETEAQQGVRVSSVKAQLWGWWVRCPAPLLGAGAKENPSDITTTPVSEIPGQNSGGFREGDRQMPA